MPRDLLMRHRRLDHHESIVEPCTVNLNQKDATVTEASTAAENLDPNSSPVETRTMNFNQNDTPETEERLAPSLDTSQSSPTLLLPVTEPAEDCSVIPSASVPELPFEHSHYTGLMSHDPISNFDFNSTYEFEMMWNNSNDIADFLPATFFDTDFSLSDIWQTDNIRLNNSMAPVSHTETSIQHSIPSNSDGSLSFISLPSRLPPLEPDSLSSRNERLPHNELNSPTGVDHATDTETPLPWVISALAYDRIAAGIRKYENILPAGFLIPSRHTISRYISGYFRGFHEHFPFIHPPTLKMDKISPELLLAMVAMGAFCRVEKRKGYKLYLASKAIILHQLEKRTRLSLAGLARGLSNTPSNRSSGSNPANIDGRERYDPRYSPSKTTTSPLGLQTLQSLVILIAMAMWADMPAVQDALSMGSQLAMLTREAGLGQGDEIIGRCAWSDWINREERRRTLFVSYILLNLCSISFDVPPLILNQEIRLSLPHCNTEWVNTSAAEWQYTRETYGHTERQFQSTLADMMTGTDVHHEEPLSALGNYALINALIQSIYFERQSTTSHTIRLDIVKKFESALQAWQRSWEATLETSLDPESPRGPLGFNSAALLRLAYLRLNANLGPCRNLLSQDPQSIALIFTNNSPPLFTRSLHVDRAVLQCIHALSIPVRVGVAFAACTQSVNGSIQHPLCTLECAILLSRWLGIISDAIEKSGLESLREDERKLLGMIASLIRETDWADTLESNEADSYCIRRMAATVVRLWAETFQGVHIFEIVRVIGETLSIVAEILERRLEPQEKPTFIG
ncbi:Transcription factor, fungi [Penicillium expansum]|uniref:Transcription factor, fungi n=1 Tax=Penicillium expansum TaxID=27334 RepID=A0A0A2K5H8_PENEN|nr:Transcription factor, fungi [Penicillium expansum]KGO40564.1 Transcription factor, fungi [Penicillium expansum]KGO63039.1 Transcription factor, fungi [Penicillium expansum]KGO67251.1 Transcription factor, fungi [Penicillium expansum]